MQIKHNNEMKRRLELYTQKEQTIEIKRQEFEKNKELKKTIMKEISEKKV